MVEEPVWRKKAIALELFHDGGFPREGHQRLVVDRRFPPGLSGEAKAVVKRVLSGYGFYTGCFFTGTPLKS